MTPSDAMTLNNINFWQAGVPLSRAPFNASSHELKKRYNEALSTSYMEAIVQASKAERDAGKEGFEALIGSMQSAQPLLSERSNIIDEMRAPIEKHLLLGNLIGFGFEPPRKMESQPFEIPRNCWKGWIDWAGSKVRGEGLEFVEVRLITAQKKARLGAPQSAADTIETRQVGRPGIGPHVAEAFKILNEAGKIETSASAKSHFPLVRRLLSQTYPDVYPLGHKISDEGIRAHFSPLFKALKKSRKQ